MILFCKFKGTSNFHFFAIQPRGALKLNCNLPAKLMYLFLIDKRFF
jgi:hypothetical protein